MIELSIEKEGFLESIDIKKYNNIIFTKPINLLNFYKTFDYLINDRDENIKIKLGMKYISYKDYILVNLMDIDSIINELKYKKGTVIYEYVNNILENLDYEYKIEIDKAVEKTFDEIKQKLCFKSHLSFDTDISKLFNSQATFFPIIDDLDFIDTLKNVLSEVLLSKINKTFIIFINSDLINYDFSNHDNVYIFDISTKNNILEYNIIIDSIVKNFDDEMLFNYLKLNWPINSSDSEIKNVSNIYFKYYINQEIIETNESNILIVSKLINKILNFDKKIIFDENKIEDIVKSFLKSFK